MEQQPNTMFLRLNTGEDLISAVKEKSDGYVLVNPLKIIYSMTSVQDALVLSFAPWIVDGLCTTQEFPIQTHDIITINKATERVVKCYNQFVSRKQKENLDMSDVLEEKEIEMLKAALEQASPLSSDRKKRLN